MTKLTMNESIRSAAEALTEEIEKCQLAYNALNEATAAEQQAADAQAKWWQGKSVRDWMKEKVEGSEAWREYKKLDADYQTAAEKREKAEILLEYAKCNRAARANGLNIAVFDAIKQTYPNKVPGAATCDKIKAEINSLLSSSSIRIGIFRACKYGDDVLMVYCSPTEYGQDYATTEINKDSSDTTGKIAAYGSRIYCKDDTGYYPDPEKLYKEAEKTAAEYNAAIKKANALYRTFEKLVPSRYTERTYIGELVKLRGEKRENSAQED